MSVWLDEQEASRFVGRSAWTLWSWRSRGMVKSGRRGSRIVYERDSLVAAKRLATFRHDQSKVTMRNVRYCDMAGPGRGHRKPAPNDDQLVLFVLG